MANIRDVAKRAGVSVATVSRVINGSPNVAPKTAQAVSAAMQELHFTPNGLARGLALNRTKTIALLLPSIVNPLYAQMAKGVEDVAHSKGYNVLLCNTDENVAKERSYVDMLLERRVDGLLLMTTRLEREDFAKLSERALPFVIIGRNIETLDANMVYTDYVLGGYLATEHLVEAEYECIAHISGPLSQLESREKLLGYQQALRQHRLAGDEQYVVAGDNEIEGGYLAAMKLLNMSPRPQAIFAANDLMAIGALDAAKTQNLRVPQDVAIVGFDDITMAAHVEPRLTTVAHPVHKMGLIAARLLFDDIDSGTAEAFGQKIFIRPKLRVRNSCGHQSRLQQIFN